MDRDTLTGLLAFLIVAGLAMVCAWAGEQVRARLFFSEARAEAVVRRMVKPEALR